MSKRANITQDQHYNLATAARPQIIQPIQVVEKQNYSDLILKTVIPEDKSCLAFDDSE